MTPTLITLHLPPQNQTHGNPSYLHGGGGRWLPTTNGGTDGTAAAGHPALLTQARLQPCSPLNVVYWALLSLMNGGAYPSSDELTSPSGYWLTLCFPALGSDL